MPLEMSAMSYLLVALGCGLLIGIERERRKGVGAQRGFAGVRSFALTALMGAVAHLLQLSVLGACLILGLCLISHWRDQSDDPGITTELALFSCYLVGVLTPQAQELAVGLAVIIAVLLNLRSDLHHFSTVWLKDHELRDGLMFAAAALVALPLLPNAPQDWLLGANPRRLWGLVVVLMGLQAIGYMALRLQGPQMGLAISGFGSGFVSSTATVAAMGTRYREQPILLASCVAAAMFSTVATFCLLFVVCVTVAPNLLASLAPALAAGLLVSLILAVLAMRSQAAIPEPSGGDASATTTTTTSAADASSAATPTGHAFSFKQALIFACILSTATALLALANQHFGQAALNISSTLAGLADVHAASASLLSLVSSGKLSANQILLPLLLAISSNTLSKILAAILAGGWVYAWRVGGALLLVLLASWSPLIWRMFAGG